MKRVLIIVALIAVAWFGITIVKDGFQNENFNIDIASYQGLEEKSAGLTKSVSNYNTKNQDEYQAELVNLNNSIKKYKNSKAQYEELIAELDNESPKEILEEQVIYSDKKRYDIDFLLTTLGTYGNKEGVTVTLELEKSTTQDANASKYGYTLCNLRFMLTGTYVDIANFLYDIEGDSELAFEIRDFNMTKNEADFAVKDVRINSDTLIETKTTNSTPNPSTTTPSGTTNNTTSNTNTTNNTNRVSNNVNSNNVSNSTNRNTNTVNNTNVTNNTVR